MSVILQIDTVPSSIKGELLFHIINFCATKKTNNYEINEF